MPTNHAISSAILRPSLASLTSGPPQRASIPVLALEAQPPTGLLSRPTCRGAGPFEVLKTQDSRAIPVGRPRAASLQCRPANNRFEGYRDPTSRTCSRRQCCECQPELFGSCGCNRCETQRKQATQ